MGDVSSRCEDILCYCPSNWGRAMAMQCEDTRETAIVAEDTNTGGGS